MRFMVDHVKPNIAHHRVFRTGESPHQPKFCSSPSAPYQEKLPPKNFYPPTPPPIKRQCSSYNPIKTAFSAVAIAPAPLF